MSTAGTTLPGRTWISSKPPNYTAPPPNDYSHRDSSPGPSVTASTPIRYDPKRPGGTIFSERTFNTFKKTDKPGILKKLDGDKKNQGVRFSEGEAFDESEREVVTTKAGGLIIRTTKPYETVVAERDALLESDKVYRKRIKQLEEENANVLLDYESVYKENNILRDKIDKGDDNRVESYQRVYADRQILREAETAYKRRITQLEHDAKGMLKNFESLYSENKVLRDKAKTLNDRLNAVDRLNEVKKLNELEKKVKLLEKTVRTMGYEREDLVRQHNEQDNLTYKLREEIADLNKRNVLLDRENEGLKRGFMALGNDVDDSWKKDLKQKTRRQEEEENQMRREHAQFRREIEKLTKELHEVEKVNVELTTKTNMLEADKSELERRVYDMARESGKRTPSAVKRRDADVARLNAEKLAELTEKFDQINKENIALKAQNHMMAKEKETFEQRIEEAGKQKRETASSIRRKVETEREIRDLNMHVDNFKEKLKRLEVENNDLKEEMKRMEIDSKAHREASKALASGQASQMDTQMKDLNDKIIALNKEIKNLTEENLKLRTEYNNVEEKLNDQLETIKKEKDMLQHEKESLKNDINQSTSTSSGKIQALQDEINELQVELQLLKPKHEDLQKLYDELKTESKSASDKYEAKENELEQLKDAIRNNKDVYNELSKSQREVASLKRELNDADAKFKNERLKLESDLEELLKNQEFMNTALAEHKVRLDMLQQEKNDLKADNVKLVKANERQLKTISDLKADVEKVSGEGSSATKSLKGELERIQKELKKTETSLIQAKQELEIAKNERENQVSKLLKQMDILKTERETETKQLKDQSESLRSEVARLKVFEDRIKSMETNLKELVQKLRETEDRNKETTNSRLMSLQQVVKEMKSENLANRIRAAEKEQNELEKHKLELEIKQDAINEIRKLKEENGRLLGLIEDKRAAEEEQDEWAKRKNKFNEILAQNRRLQEENTRLLKIVEDTNAKNVKQDLETKTQKLKLIEAKYQQFFHENAELRKNMEEKDSEMQKLVLKVERITRIQHENRRLVVENQKLREDNTKKDNTISSLKELEVTKAKYMDSATNNQRLYEENMRLRDNIEKSKDYKSEFLKAKDKEKDVAASSAKLQEENLLLKNTLQVKETELRREIELQKERATNCTARNKRLTEEVAKLKSDIKEKDDLIIKLRGLETAQGKLKDASVNVSRLYEENQRLRNLLEMGGSGWKSNFQNAKSLSTATKTSEVKTAQYIESTAPKRKPDSQVKKTEYSSLNVSLSSQNLDDDSSASEMKIKPLSSLPYIKEGSGLVTGLGYSALHQKNKGMKSDRLIQSLSNELDDTKARRKVKEKELSQLNGDMIALKVENRRLTEERNVLKAEVVRLKKEMEIKAIAESVSNKSQIVAQNRRLSQENQRLRDEINMRDLELSQRGITGYNIAHYVENKTQKEKTTEEKLKLATVENNRLREENDRLRASLDEAQQQDTGSRFKNPNVTGSMIEGFKNAKSNKWATSRKDTASKRADIARQANETDDNKLMKIDEMA
ncbi:hypothetical protein ACF0H5_001445 [Mactra antiquata]